MDAKKVREWRENYRAVNRFIDEERAKETYFERWKQLKQLWDRGASLNAFQPKPFDYELSDRWNRLRKAYAEKH